MLACLIQIDAYDPTAGASVSLYASSLDDPAVCMLNGLTWWPAISKLPALRYDLFDGSFSGQITAPSSSITLTTEAWPNFGRYALADARFRLWAGSAGDAWASYTLRFDGRVTDVSSLKDGLAELDFAADDRWLDAALMQTYAGTTGAEGSADLKGQAKPLALGAPAYVPGKLIDTPNNVFQISNGPIQAVTAAMERLARFAAPIANYASYAALVAATIPAGSWATATGVGMVRFGAPPTGKVSFLVQGDIAGANGWARKPGQIVRRLATLAGGTGKINDASLNALDVARPYNISVYLDEATTARDLVQKLAASVNAVAGVSWTGQLFTAPVGLAAPTMTLSADGSSLPPVASVEQIDAGVPWKQLTIGAARTWEVHDLSDIAFEATLTDRGRYDAATTYREGDIVDLADQSRWLHQGTAPTTGVAPTEGAAWTEISQPLSTTDINYPDGTPVADLQPSEPGATNSADPTSPIGSDGKTVADLLSDISHLKEVTTPDTTAPGVPTGLAVTSALLKDGSVDLSAAWTASTASDFAFYVFKVALAGGGYVSYNAPSNAIVLHGLLPNEAFSVQVEAVDLSGNHSGFGPVISGTTVVDTTPPGAPTSFAILPGIGSLYVSWTNPADLDLASVRMWMGSDTNFANALAAGRVAATPGAGGTWAITGLTTAATKYYWIAAVDTSGNTSTVVGPLAGTPVQVNTADLAAGAVTQAKFATGITPVEILASLPTTGNYAGRTVFLTTDGKTYRYTSAGVWTASTAAADVTGQITGAQLSAGAIDLTKFASGLTPVEVVSTLPSSGNYTGRTVFLTTDGKLYRFTAGAFSKGLDGGDLVSNTVTTGAIAAGAITTSQVAAGAITTSKLAVIADNLSPDPTFSDASFFGVYYGNTPFTQYGALPDIRNGGGGSAGWYRDITANASATLGVDSMATLWGGTASWTQHYGERMVLQSNAAIKNVTVGKSYELAARVTNSTSQTLHVIAVFLKADGSAAGSIEVAVPPGTYNKTMTSTGTCPAGTISWLVQIFNGGTNFGDGAFPIGSGMFVSAYSLREQLGASMIVNGSITADKLFINSVLANMVVANITTTNALNANVLVSGSITAGLVAAGAIGVDQLAAGSVVASKIAITGASLFPDGQVQDAAWWSQSPVPGGGYQNPANSWYIDTNPDPAVVAAKGSLNAWVTLPTGTTANNVQLVAPTVGGVIPGEHYEFKATLFNSTNRPNLQMVAQWRQADGTYISGALIGGCANDSTTRQVSGQLQAPAGAAYYLVYWDANGSTAALTGQCYVGGISVRQANGGTMIVDGQITAAKLAVDYVMANTIIANTTVVTGAFAAGVISSVTSMPGSIAVTGTGFTLSTIASNASTGAQDPAGRINAGSTLITPGKIQLAGGTTLTNWIFGGDNTLINGGAIATNTITANKVVIGLRGVQTIDIQFDTNRVNTVSWTGGYIEWQDDAGNRQVAQINAGSQYFDPANTTAVVYVWFDRAASPGSHALYSGMPGGGAAEILGNSNNVILAVYRNGTNLVVYNGRTIIDGDSIKTGTVSADRLIANSITGAYIAAQAITGDKIAAGTILAANIQVGTITADRFLTNAGVDLAAIVPGSLNWRTSVGYGTQLGPTTGNWSSALIGPTGSGSADTSAVVTFTGVVSVMVGGGTYPYDNATGMLSVYYSLNGGAWTSTGISFSMTQAYGNGFLSGDSGTAKKWTPPAAGTYQFGYILSGSESNTGMTAAIPAGNSLSVEVVNWK